MHNNYKKLLLCDANFCVLPIVETVMTRGYHLSVVGAKIDDPAHLIANNSITINYSDINLLYKHISQNSYDGLIPGCNDKSYISLAYIAKEMNFPGFDDYETVLNIHNKERFRKISQHYNYPIPKSINSIENIKSLELPVLVKPTDSFSGKGVNIANTLDELKEYWEIAKTFSASDSAIIEEFIEGDLYSHSAFIKNGKIIIDFFVNEYCTVYPYQVNSSNVSTQLDAGIQESLRNWTEKFADDLKLCDGLVHTQFISNNTTFYLIEVARRCPGDLYSQLIQKSTGINYAELYAMPFCGLELPDKIEKSETKFIARHTVSVEEDCIFISSSLNIKNTTIQNIQLKYSGEQMKAAPFDKSGIYFIEYQSAKEMEESTKKLKNFISIETLDIKQVQARD